MKTKNIARIMVMVFMLTCLAGCGNSKTDENAKTEDNNQTNSMEYSNLVDLKTQEEVKEKLIAAGIPQDSADIYMDWAQDFNSRVGDVKAFKDGFTKADLAEIDYQDVFLEQRELENGDLQMDPNCRMTGFLLMKDMITVGSKIEQYDNYLMFDMEAIENDPRYEVLKKQKDKFVTLLNPIEVTEGSTYDEHVEKIQEEWEKRGIEFEEKDKISFITLFVHENYENKRFVGHLGVLLQEDEGVLFVEKIASDEPYQTTKFASEEDLVKYLLSRADLYGDGTEEKPIIMKNKTVIS